MRTSLPWGRRSPSRLELSPQLLQSFQPPNPPQRQRREPTELLTRQLAVMINLPPRCRTRSKRDPPLSVSSRRRINPSQAMIFKARISRLKTHRPFLLYQRPQLAFPRQSIAADPEHCDLCRLPGLQSLLHCPPPYSRWLPRLSLSRIDQTPQEAR